LLAAGIEALHKDPADRFIAATAIVKGATLVTADAKRLEWKHRMQRHDATR
jgi:PIN domain nuclease of toxin-antitoxin system